MSEQFATSPEQSKQEIINCMYDWVDGYATKVEIEEDRRDNGAPFVVSWEKSGEYTIQVEGDSEDTVGKMTVSSYDVPEDPKRSVTITLETDVSTLYASVCDDEIDFKEKPAGGESKDITGPREGSDEAATAAESFMNDLMRAKQAGLIH